ncbi:unnamed protein product [Effrenium voratum]|nr:unnamed protein product [Effrenium voratum]
MKRQLQKQQTVELEVTAAKVVEECPAQPSSTRSYSRKTVQLGDKTWPATAPIGKGMRCRYWSQTHGGCWLPARVEKANPDGTFDLDIKQHACIENISPTPDVPEAEAWPPGTSVSYNSTSAQRWIPAVVQSFNDTCGSSHVLLENGACPDAAGREGVTCLELLLRKEREESAPDEWLRQCGEVLRKHRATLQATQEEHEARIIELRKTFGVKMVGALLTLQSPISMPAEILEVLHLLFRQLPPEVIKESLEPQAYCALNAIRDPVTGAVLRASGKKDSRNEDRDANPMNDAIPGEVVRRNEKTQKTGPSAKALAETDIQLVLAKGSGTREKWLKKALQQVQDGELPASEVYNILKVPDFAQDLKDKTGRSMYKFLISRISVFSKGQQRFLAKECTLAQLFGGEGGQSMGSEGSKQQDPEAAEEMMARVRQFVRQQQGVELDQAVAGVALAQLAAAPPAMPGPPGSLPIPRQDMSAVANIIARRRLPLR